MPMGKARIVVVVMLAVALILASFNQSLVDAQTSSNASMDGLDTKKDGKAKVFGLRLSTIPDRLVRGEDAYLIIQAHDDRGNPVPLLPEITSISVLNSDAVSISDSVERVGSAYAVKIKPLKSMDTKVTVVARGPSMMLGSMDIRVYEPLDRPSGLALSIKPSSISYIGPREGYIAVQLLNAKGEPVTADKDYLIDLGSSNPDLLQLSSITIKQGSNYAYTQFRMKDVVPSPSQHITITARHGSMYAEGTVKVESPGKEVLRLYVMDTVPAVRGHEVYAFIQLQDSDGNAIYAEQDMKVEVKPDGMLMTGGTGVIRKGESTTVVSLYVNTDKTCEAIAQGSDGGKGQCVSIIATSGNLTSNKAMVELVEPVYIDGSKYIGEVKEISVMPRIFPSNMPIIADGRSKVIGAVQLVSSDGGNGDSSSSGGRNGKSTGIRPVIVPMDTPIDIVSDNRLAVEDTRVTVARGKSAALIQAKVGYDASGTMVYTVSDYVDDASFRLSMQGHKGITIVGEPLLSKVTKGMSIPYIVYFSDADGYSSYALDDMSLRVSTNDKVEVIKGSSIAKGHASTIVQLRAVKGGDATVHVEAVGSTVRYTGSGGISIADVGNLKVNISTPDVMLSNSKTLAALEMVDADGYPVHVGGDVRALLFSTGASVPEMLVIPKGKYFTLFTVETDDKGYGSGAGITAMVDGFGIVERTISIIDSNTPTLKLSAPESVRPMEPFDVVLDASYAGVQLSNVLVSWSSDLAVLTNMYDSSTDGQGKAMARFIAYREGVITVNAKISGYGIEESASIMINGTTSSSPIGSNDGKSDSGEVESNDSLGNGNNDDSISIPTTDDVTSMLDQIPIDTEYLLMLPALGGIATWYVNKKFRKRGV